MHLQGKKIILAISGSIAAYKTPALVRLLTKAGAEVRVLMTEAATDFVTPLSLSTVAGSAVLQDVHDGATWANHVALGLWADAMLVAPCSANTLAKMANGQCDNLLLAVYLSARCPVFIAPAMDEDMWHHPSTQKNLQSLQSIGNIYIPVEHGSLASGLVGLGRMAEPESIVSFLNQYFHPTLPLKGLKALVTAGPTHEAIDPVRYIGNRSTGKMGIALAEALAAQGAEVTLVLGPTHLSTQKPGIHTVKVEQAQEMYDACWEVFPKMDIAIMSAAVADYTPTQVATQKIKKTGEEGMNLPLVKTVDILHSLGKIKSPQQTLVGFALETNDALHYGQQKLKDKNADMIVVNSLQDAGAGFGHDTNKVTLVTAHHQETLPLMPKSEVAHAIVNHLIRMRND